MENNESTDIAIAPGNSFDEEIIRKLAALLDRDLYYARAALSSKIPRIIFRQKGPQRGEEFQKQLKELGLVSFTFKENDIQKPLRLFKASSCDFEENNWIFKDKNSKLYELERNRIFLILKGNLQTSGEKETVTNTQKLNITATLLSGGIPIRRNVQEKKRETTVESEGFVRIFEKDSPDACLEIKQKSFNYACLGKEMAGSSKQNISLIARKIKDFFPEAFFDDNLNQFPMIGSSVNPMDTNIDVNCKLIYLNYSS
jgi:hypothetical protein